MVDICIIYDKLRFEEKALYNKAIQKGLKARTIDAKNISICTDSKKSGRAEIHVAAVAAENVPGRCENDELQDDKAGIKNVIVAKPQCAGEAGQADQHCDNEENR